jgi:hypothetical protein
MALERSDMLYNDGYYKWSARADHDNPYYKKGVEHSEINKTEGYEVLYFLNHLGEKRLNFTPTIETYHKMERILRYHVPPRSTHKKADDFIIDNWNKY